MSEIVNKLKSEIKEIEEKENQLRDLKRQKQTELAETLCPFKVGQKGKLNGHSYKGKYGEILSVYWKYDRWHCNVAVMKADGSVGSNVTEIYSEKDFLLEF